MRLLNLYFFFFLILILFPLGAVAQDSLPVSKSMPKSKMRTVTKDLKKSLEVNDEVQIAQNYERLANEFLNKGDNAKAEEYFKNDSLNLALNGDGTNKGFLYVIKNYGGSKSGELANFYAGNIFLRNGDFNNAIKYLKDFSTDSKQIQMIAYGRLGDAYSELKKNDEAVDHYKKAGHAFPEDEFNASEFLFRAGYLLESLGKNSEAIEVYKEIKQKYPRTEKGFSIDKFIYRLSLEKNEFSVK